MPITLSVEKVPDGYNRDELLNCAIFHMTQKNNIGANGKERPSSQKFF